MTLKTMCVGVQIRENPEPLEHRGKFCKIKNKKILWKQENDLVTLDPS